MFGLGDNFYQRSVIQELKKVIYLHTPWPQLYVDLPFVKCIRPKTSLRTQNANIDRGWNWAQAPSAAVRVTRWHYPASGNMLEGLANQLKVKPRIFNGPPVVPSEKSNYVVVRPATIRSEWRADSRNPDPKYINQACLDAAKAGFKVVSVADLSPGAEWPVEPLPYADEIYHAGELKIQDLLSLVSGACGVIGGVGWLVPAAVAYNVPMLLIYGGWGANNGPQRILHPVMDVSKIRQVIPDRFCMCSSDRHDCNKTIKGFEDVSREWSAQLNRV